MATQTRMASAGFNTEYKDNFDWRQDKTNASSW